MKRRLWLQIMALLVLAVQGMYDLTLCYAVLLAPRIPATVRTATLERHFDYCLCRSCVGDKKCCCRPTNNAGASALLTAACDTPDDAQIARFIKYRSIPPIFTQRQLPQISETVPFPTLTQTAPSRASQPPTQPPRLS